MFAFVGVFYGRYLPAVPFFGERRSSMVQNRTPAKTIFYLGCTSALLRPKMLSASASTKRSPVSRSSLTGFSVSCVDSELDSIHQGTLPTMPRSRDSIFPKSFPVGSRKCHRDTHLLAIVLLKRGSSTQCSTTTSPLHLAMSRPSLLHPKRCAFWWATPSFARTRVHCSYKNSATSSCVASRVGTLIASWTRFWRCYSKLTSFGLLWLRDSRGLRFFLVLCKSFVKVL